MRFRLKFLSVLAYSKTRNSPSKKSFLFNYLVAQQPQYPLHRDQQGLYLDALHQVLVLAKFFDRFLEQIPRCTRTRQGNETIGGRHLNECLNKRANISALVAPDVLPLFVSFPIVSGIEKLDALTK